MDPADHNDKGKAVVEAQTLLDPSSSDQAKDSSSSDATAELYLFRQILRVVQTMDENLSGNQQDMRESMDKMREFMDRVTGNDHEDKGKVVVEAQTLSDPSSSQANDSSFDGAELVLFHQILQVFQTMNEKFSRYEPEVREFLDKMEEFIYKTNKAKAKANSG